VPAPLPSETSFDLDAGQAASVEDPMIRHHLERAAALLTRSGALETEQLKRLLILSALSIVLAGCALPESRDVRAYNTCTARHPRELAVCEGPRQAYELNPTALEARAAAVGVPADSGHERLSPAARPSIAPVPLHPSTLTSGRNG